MSQQNQLTRRGALEGLGRDILDVLIVGGGIVGSGVARDAAMRGLRVGLVEQYDFAAGTSSRSSRLLHGGLRYLAQGRIGLVHEASEEKRVIHRIAPHLAQPLPFLFPTRAGDRNWPLWKLKIGVKLYDALCGWKNLGRSQWLTAQQALERLPALKTQELNGAVRYFDGLTNDARLVLDTLRSAARHGAIPCNHARMEQARQHEGLWHCEARDTVDDQLHAIRAHWVVNAGGPWANRLPNSTLPLRLTKGVHLVIDRTRLPVPDAVVLTEGRRILFVIPWGERVILGTTDTDFTGRIEDVRCERADVEYLLSIANANFPEAPLQFSDVLSAWAGVRPLIAGKSGHPSDASRSHEIRQSGPQWLEVGGGKLTTYRLMAEQVVDQIAHAESSRKLEPCRTATEPLVEPGESDGLSAIVPPELTQRAVEHYCRNEWAMHLDDVMIRRSSWHYYLTQPEQAAEQVATWMAQILHWDTQRIQQELATYRALAGNRSGTAPVPAEEPLAATC